MKIKYNRANVYTINGIRFMPGSNEITDAQYNAIKDRPGFANRVEQGVIEVEQAKRGRPKKESEPLPEIDEPKEAE